MPYRRNICIRVITISTVGFEEVHPLDEQGVWFTSVLVIFSIGIFAYAVTILTRFIVEGVFRNSFKYSTMKRRMEPGPFGFEISGHNHLIYWDMKGGYFLVKHIV
ncbi:MAG: ion channel [Bacteroidota bacterium]